MLLAHQTRKRKRIADDPGIPVHETAAMFFNRQAGEILLRTPIDMAKKKTAKETEKTKLTDEQIKQLGDKLIDTCKNIYAEVRSMFGEVEVNDETFDRLEKLGELFRCDECNVWQSTSLKDKFCESTCEDCVAAREEEGK